MNHSMGSTQGCARRVKCIVKQLNRRLSSHGITIQRSGDSRNIIINRHSIAPPNPSVWLSEARFKRLMLMSDTELVKYFKAWGRKTEAEC